MTNKKGMTLVELMVYMVLAALLLAPVIMLVQNSSVSMARDASNVSLRMTGRELLNIIYDDLKNTGYKLDPGTFKANDSVSYIDLAGIATALTGKTTAADTAAAIAEIRTGAPDKLDSSSFRPGRGVGVDKFYDTVTVRIGRLSNTGAWIGGGIDTITYFVDRSAGNLLKRRITNKDGVNDFFLARNVEALKFRYSADLADWYDTFNTALWPEADGGVEAKIAVKYIKVIIVTKDPKKLAPTKTSSITLIQPGDGDPAGIIFPCDNALYERHETVIPIPNNGLFP